MSVAIAMNVGHGFAAGARAVFRGAATIASNRVLWPYAIAPLVLASFAFALGLFGGIELATALAERWFHGWTGWFWGSLRGVAVAFACLAALLVSMVAARLVILPIAAAPFNSLLSARVEELMTGRPLPDVPFRDAVRQLLPAALRGVATTLYGLAVLIVCLPLLLVPAIGFILYLLPSAHVEALSALDATFGRKSMSLAAKRTWLAQRRPLAMGFGAAILLGNLVPLGTLLVVPAAAAGGALLVTGESKA